MTSTHRVVVLAGSIEGIDALARLVRGLPADFPVPVVAYVHGLHDDSMARLMHRKLASPSTIEVVFACDRQRVEAGRFYIAPAGHELIFTSTGVLGCAPSTQRTSADRLFESAAAWHGAGVIGIVLSGLGSDGVRGFQAITEVGGIRMVQSPSEASFTAMPSNALLGDHVQYSVMLDQMERLLQDLLLHSQLPDDTSRTSA